MSILSQNHQGLKFAVNECGTCSSCLIGIDNKNVESSNIIEASFQGPVSVISEDLRGQKSLCYLHLESSKEIKSVTLNFINFCGSGRITLDMNDDGLINDESESDNIYTIDEPICFHYARELESDYSSGSTPIFFEITFSDNSTESLIVFYTYFLVKPEFFQNIQNRVSEIKQIDNFSMLPNVVFVNNDVVEDEERKISFYNTSWNRDNSEILSYYNFNKVHPSNIYSGRFGGYLLRANSFNYDLLV